MEVATDINADLYARLKVPSRDHVKRVIALVGSSRGGTSHLFQLLQRSHQLLTPRAEDVPFAKMHLPGTGNDDGPKDWHVQPDAARKWWSALACDLGVGEASFAGDWDTYPMELATRIAMQWPLDAHDVLEV